MGKGKRGKEKEKNKLHTLPKARRWVLNGRTMQEGAAKEKKS